MKLSVLMPAFEEERTIGVAAERVASCNLGHLGVEVELVICDDGSTDGTAAEVRRLQRSHSNIKLVSLPENRGKGSAIRAALEYATGEYILIQDADLEYGVESYSAMLDAVQRGAEVVYGSRFLGKRFPDGMRRANFLANKILTWLSNALFSCGITDEATCLKLFRADLIRALQLKCQRFEFCPEVTAKLGLLRVPIVEVPVRYSGRDLSEGKKVRWTDGIQAAIVLLSHRYLWLRSGRNVTIGGMSRPTRPALDGFGHSTPARNAPLHPSTVPYHPPAE